MKLADMFVFGFRNFCRNEVWNLCRNGVMNFCRNGVRKIFIFGFFTSFRLLALQLFELFIIQTYNQACLLEHFSNW